MKPADLRLIRLTLALIWLVTGSLSLGIYPQQESLSLLSRIGLPGTAAFTTGAAAFTTGAAAYTTLYLAATLDMVLGVLTLFMRAKILWMFQALLIIFYTLIISVWLSEFWLHPFGPILKNLAILVLLWLLYRYESAQP